MFVRSIEILIESQWNLNETAGTDTEEAYTILIESQWNLNYISMECLLRILQY